MSACPTEEELLAAVARPVRSSGVETPAPVRSVEAHIATCEACRTVLGLLLSSGAADEAPPSSTGLSAGDCLGHYRLREVLGAGAMSVVYRAIDERLDRAVALKVLRWDRGLGDADALLRKEARALARVSSRFVVEVFDVGEHLGAMYVVMELVAGSTLRRYAQRSTSSTEKASTSQLLDAIVQAGTGLADAHDAGVIHGDVKPENILVSERRDARGALEIEAKISDFGLALVPRARTSSEYSDDSRSGEERSLAIDQTSNVLASASNFVGTPAYMAPELFWGTSPNAASDQFAFCVTAYEALAGERPFANLGADELRALNDVALLARAARLPLPAAAARALLRGLHPDPAKRHPSVRALVEALRPRRWGPGLVAAAAIGLAAIVGVAAWSLATRPPPDRCLEVAKPAETLGSAASRQRLREAFLATHAEGAGEGARIVDTEWARYLQEWTSERVATCRGTTATATPSAGASERSVRTTPPYSAAEACLDARLADARAFHDVALRVTPATVGAVTEAVYLLPAPRSCLADVAPGDGATHAAISPQWLAKLAAARAQFHAGEQASAHASLAEIHAEFAGAATTSAPSSASRTDAVVENSAPSSASRTDAVVENSAPSSASRTDAYRFAADVAWLDGALAEAEDRFEEAAKKYEESALLATRADDARRAFAAEVALVPLLGYRLNRPEAAHVWEEHAEALLDAPRGLETPLMTRESPRGALLRARGANAFGRGDYTRAVELFSGALREEKSGNPTPTPALALTLRRLAQSERAAGDHLRAIEHGREGLELRVRFFGANHRATAEMQSDLGGSYLSVGNFAAAKEQLAAAYRTQANELGEEHLDTANTEIRLGNLALAQGDSATAAARYRGGLKVLRRLLGDRNPEIALTTMNLGIAEMGEKRWEPAARAFVEAREALARTAPDNVFYLLRIRMAEGELSRLRTDHPSPESALALHREVLAKILASGKPDARSLREVYTEIGLDLVALQRWSEADASFAHAWEAMPASGHLLERSEIICGWRSVLRRLPTGRKRAESLFEAEREAWKARPLDGDSPREKEWRACVIGNRESSR